MHRVKRLSLRGVQGTLYQSRWMSGEVRWAEVSEAPKDPILGVAEAFRADTNPEKVNLGVGAYRDDDGKPVVLPSVLEASKRILDLKMDNEYAPIDGDKEFIELSLKLAYGDSLEKAGRSNIAAVQALSGTGALRLFGEFIKHHSGTGTLRPFGEFIKHRRSNPPKIYVPNPTWGNHHSIFQHCGLETQTYRYYDNNSFGLNIEGMLDDIKQAPTGSVLILHACAHNPTGVDPSPEQWKAISDACKEKNHIVVFDSAYQGFASGDPNKDAYSIRLFVDEGHTITLCQSFAKNFGLYGHRVGLLSMLCGNSQIAQHVQSQWKVLARAMYSNPPIHGSRIVKLILSDKELKERWLSEVNGMASRIQSMRSSLRTHLESLGDKKWNHITDQIGMFCYTGLSPEQVDRITTNHHVYMTRNGRISMAGVTSQNIPKIAEAIHQVSNPV